MRSVIPRCSGLTLRVEDHVRLVDLPQLVPGVIRRGNRLIVPSHAARHLDAMLTTLGMVAGAPEIFGEWRIPGHRTPWSDLSSILKDNGELRPSYLDDWILPYQKDALCVAAERTGTLLDHPTGSGKTYTGIVWALLYDGPVLIVTKAATRQQYIREIERFTRLKAFLCKPQGAIRKKDQWRTLTEYLNWCKEESQRPIMVVAWPGLSSWLDRLLPVIRDGSIIYDETQTGKNRKRWECVVLPSQRDPKYKAAVKGIRARKGVVKPSRDGRGMVGLVPMRNVSYCASALSKAASRRLGGSASLIPDRVRDLWGQLDIIDRDQDGIGRWGKYFDFVYRYCAARKDRWGGIDDSGSSHLDELRIRIDHVIHRVEGSEVRKNMPSMRRQTWYIPPSEQVKPTGAWKRALRQAERRGGTAGLEVRLAAAASAKRKAILDRLPEYLLAGQHVTIFTARQRDCEELIAAISRLKIKGTCVPVWGSHGGHTAEEQESGFRAYLAHKGHCVFVGTGQRWGTGVDGFHEVTETAILALLPWTPGDLIQWDGRFARLGQKYPVTILYPIAEGTADEHVAERILEKLPAVSILTPTDALDGAEEALAGEIIDEDEFAACILAELGD